MAWLRELAQPQSAPRRQLAAAFLELADDEHERRESATRQLERAPLVPPALFDTAFQDSDLERRWRAHAARERSESRHASVLGAAARQLAAEPPEGLACELVDALALTRDPQLAEEFFALIRQVARDRDLESLRLRLRQSDPAARRGAVVGLAAILADSQLTELRPPLDDPDPAVALEAARALLNRSQRLALPHLTALLRHERMETRAAAHGILRAATRQDFGFDPYNRLDHQATALADWERWTRDQGLQAPLELPVRWHSSPRGDLAGNTLVSTGRRGQVLEFDPQGQVVWRYAAVASSAEKLPNGRVLVAAFESQRVLEVDSLGNVFWQLEGIGAMRAKPLANGHILLADFPGRRVVEVNRQGTLVWHATTPDSCFDAERLPNGHTVFACPNLVREITPDQRTIREWPFNGRLNGIHFLPNRHLLVANFGSNQVTEVDGDGRVVWKHDEKQPCDVYRLDGGNTLITSAARIVEVAPDHQVVRDFGPAWYGSARR